METQHIKIAPSASGLPHPRITCIRLLLVMSGNWTARPVRVVHVHTRILDPLRIAQREDLYNNSECLSWQKTEKYFPEVIVMGQTFRFIWIFFYFNWSHKIA